MISKSTKRIRDLFFITSFIKLFTFQKFLWLIILFIYIEATAAQVIKYKITGRVTADSEQQPLPGGKSGLILYMHNYGSSPTQTGFYATFDNSRVVKR